MGFELATTTSTDTSYASAYYKVRDVHYDLTNKRCTFSLVAFKDKAARDADKAKIKGVPTAMRYTVTGDDFDTYFGDDVLDDADKNIWKQCYAYARAQEAYAGASDVDPDV